MAVPSLPRTNPSGALGSPVRNLLGGIVFLLLVMAAAVSAYVLAAGWSPGDALYMTVITVFTVGYDEVRPVDTPTLRAITMALIVLGCSGTIFLTGALVQFITYNQFREILGVRRMKHQIEQLGDHVIVCGYGRIGNMLGRELRSGRMRTLVIERDSERLAQAQRDGHLCLQGDATEETLLRQAGIDRAAALATVLPDDAANVFITLSARSLNATLAIIARGEAPSTERKLLQAGANRVVMPAQIGAERIAEMILYPAAGEALREPARRRAADRDLHAVGAALETVVVEDGAALAGLTLAEIARRCGRDMLLLSVSSPGQETAGPADPERIVAPGDGVTVILREQSRPLLAGFRAG